MENLNLSMMDEFFLIKKVQAIVKLAGCETLSYFMNQKNHEIKKDGSPLTDADIASNRIIVESLSEYFPNIPILSEEGKNASRSFSSDLFWAVDPLDGTKEFIDGSGDFTINIALIERKKPIFGMIYAPYHSEGWFGFDTEKSSLIYEKKKYSCKFFLNCKEKNSIGNNNKIISTNNKNKSNLIIAVSKSHNSSATDIWQKIYFADKNLIQIKRGSSIKICLVAEGKANYYPRFGRTCIWDIAAGHAILSGAGGKIYRMSDFSEMTYGDSIFNDNFLACGC